jgi:NAD(P)-dependent dehydrogenase (short-subunit alcohol dehydrogenase family)
MYPAGRIGHSTDIGMLTLLLCAPASAWITGTVLPIDGGLTAYCRM